MYSNNCRISTIFTAYGSRSWQSLDFTHLTISKMLQIGGSRGAVWFRSIVTILSESLVRGVILVCDFVQSFVPNPIQGFNISIPLFNPSWREDRILLTLIRHYGYITKYIVHTVRHRVINSYKQRHRSQSVCLLFCWRIVGVQILVICV